MENRNSNSSEENTPPTSPSKAFQSWSERLYNEVRARAIDSLPRWILSSLTSSESGRRALAAASEAAVLNCHRHLLESFEQTCQFQINRLEQRLSAMGPAVQRRKLRMAAVYLHQARAQVKVAAAITVLCLVALTGWEANRIRKDRNQAIEIDQSFANHDQLQQMDALTTENQLLETRLNSVVSEDRQLRQRLQPFLNLTLRQNTEGQWLAQMAFPNPQVEINAQTQQATYWAFLQTKQ